MANPVLQEAWVHLPWYARLIIYAGATFGLAYGATGSWEGGLTALAAWLLGNQQNSIQQTKKEQAQRRGRL